MKLTVSGDSTESLVCHVEERGFDAGNLLHRDILGLHEGESCKALR